LTNRSSPDRFRILKEKKNNENEVSEKRRLRQKQTKVEPRLSLRQDRFPSQKVNETKHSTMHFSPWENEQDTDGTEDEKDEFKESRKQRKKILKNVVLKIKKMINHESFRKKFRKLNFEMFQGLTFDESHKGSYTVDKSNVFLCLKNPVNGFVYDDNSVTFVALHELSHVMNPHFGHGWQFQKMFKNVLKIASDIGIWSPDIPFATNYCGTCKNGECFTSLPIQSRFVLEIDN
jgi:hypothetical protein